MTYRVQLTAQAEADIDRIFDWLFQRSPEGARRWYEAFWESAERLKSNPLSSAVVPGRPIGATPIVPNYGWPLLRCRESDEGGCRTWIPPIHVCSTKETGAGHDLLVGVAERPGPG
jgi:ParE toxin of type II toxin-antitoxin system, parDE